MNSVTLNNVNDYTFEIPSDVIDKAVDEVDSSFDTFSITE